MRRLGLMIVVGMILSAIATFPVTAKELSADEILDQIEKAARAESQISVEKMSIINKAGQVRTREIKMWSAGTEKTLIRFLGPADVKGTGFLTVGKDMWLYLPAVGQVRRIASHMKKGSFMGSDFSYEDMGVAGYKDDYKAKLVGIDNSTGEPAYLLELLPANPEVTYGKLRLWAEKDTFIVRKIEFYDRKGTLFKVLTTSNIGLVNGRHVARQMVMENVIEKHRTVLELIEVTFGTPIPPDVFTDTYLERGQ